MHHLQQFLLVESYAGSLESCDLMHGVSSKQSSYAIAQDLKFWQQITDRNMYK